MRILVVEDDPILALTAADILADGGHEVIGPAHDVAEAMALGAGGPDFAFVDIDLAGHNEGVDLARRLMADFGVPSIFVSGQVGVAHANKDAAVGLLRKPYDPSALAEAAIIAAAMRLGRRPALSIPRALELFG